MTLITVPSSTVPAVPAFAVEIPDAWRAAPTPGALVSIGPPDRTDVTVLVSTIRVDPTDDLRSIAVRSLAQQRAHHPDLQVADQRIGRFGDRQTYLRIVELGAVHQLQALFLAGEPDGPTVDVFSIVAACPAGELDALGPVFVELVASFAFSGKT